MKWARVVTLRGERRGEGRVRERREGVEGKGVCRKGRGEGRGILREVEIGLREGRGV